MGVGASTPSLEQETKKINNVLNDILKFMLEESDLIDMYALASPEQCSKYVVFTSKSLEKFFKKVMIYPRLGQDGKFYFQRLRAFQGLTGKYLDEQRSACLEISRFFVRILHIFASISLTIIDMEIPVSNAALNELGKRVSVLQTPRIDEARFLSVPLVTGERRKTLLLRGGSILPTQPKFFITDPNYEILNKYLSLSYSSDYYTLSGTDIKIPIASVKPESPQPFLELTGKKVNTNRTITIQANLRMEKLDDLTLRVSLEFLKPEDADNIPGVNFSKTSPYAEPFYNKQNLPTYIKSKFNKILGKTENELGAINRNKTMKKSKIANLPNDDTKLGVPPYFRVKGILKALERTPPVKAYCVARALQLMSPEALKNRDATRARTQVCDSNFNLLGKGSLPIASDSITTSTSLLALNRLFFDMFKNSAPSISKEVQGKHDKFLRNMRAVYQEETTLRNEPVDKMETIKNEVNKELCSKKRGVLYTEDPDVISVLRSKANQLLTKQLQHSEKAMGILKKLFIINGSQPILLQPAVEEGGIDTIELIADEARTLLIEYYTECEVLYREGVELIKDKQEMFKTAS
jgi:hypothetical protein